MDNLTTFERALLAEFESLAASCAASGKVSAATAERLSKASEHFSGQIATLRRTQAAQSEALETLTEALDAQVKLTTTLIGRVNALARVLES